VRPLAATALSVVAGLAGGGCGLGPGKATTDVGVVVTRDFGAHRIGRSLAAAPGEDTVMRSLQRHFDVRTRYGGAFVQSIEGVSGGRRGGRAVDWFFYVNGVEAPKGAAATKVHAGDRIWWDNHDWQTAMRVPAVVGSWPEPFRSGRGGHRLPVRLDCAAGADAACDAVGRALAGVGVKLAKGTPDGPSGRDLLRVVVGPWPALRGQPAARLLELGPQRSGVFARIDRAGGRLELLDARGRVRRTETAGSGAGLIAATRYADQQPVWFVTGTDARGLRAAASALTPERLANRFAVVVLPGGDVALPVTGTS
jgi:hypothetical protein